jgi:hypothetical protein
MTKRKAGSGGGNALQGWRVALLLVIAAVCAPCLAVAAPVARPTSGREYQEYRDNAAPGRWAVAFGAGLFTSGDLFRVVVPGELARWWTAPGGGPRFYSRDYRVAVDQDLLAMISVAYHLNRRWQVRLDLGWSEVPTSAYVRVGDHADTAELIRYDRLTFTLCGLGIEARLLSTQLYPYLTAGPVLVKLSAAGATALDQTRLAIRGGAGLHLSFDPSWGVRGEIRDTVRRFDMSGYAADPVFEGAVFEARGPQNLFEFLLSVRGIF